LFFNVLYSSIFLSSGVPFSTQWTLEGHFYPIQIAQFGLSHYSKQLVEGTPEVLVMEDGEEDDVADWARPDDRAKIHLVHDAGCGSNIAEFSASGKNVWDLLDNCLTKHIDQKINEGFYTAQYLQPSILKALGYLHPNV
jgi:hypothetical protein